MPSPGTALGSTVVTTPSTLPGGSVTTPVPSTEGTVDTGDVVGFDLIEVELGDERLTLALADDSTLRSRGLMGVTDLGALDGMLFSWGGETVASRFTMRNTLIPLRIVFFDTEGVFISTTDMVPCEVTDCPAYGAAGPYAFAIEFPAGTAVSPEDRLDLAPAD